MIDGSSFDFFFKSYVELSNQEKIEKLKQYSTGDMLALLRIIEENPGEFDEEIIKAVFSCLYNKGIMCI